jgi:hypothetical protein
MNAKNPPPAIADNVFVLVYRNYPGKFMNGCFLSVESTSKPIAKPYIFQLIHSSFKSRSSAGPDCSVALSVIINLVVKLFKLIEFTQKPGATMSTLGVKPSIHLPGPIDTVRQQLIANE